MIHIPVCLWDWILRDWKEMAQTNRFQVLEIDFPFWPQSIEQAYVDQFLVPAPPQQVQICAAKNSFTRLASRALGSIHLSLDMDALPQRAVAEIFRLHPVLILWGAELAEKVDFDNWTEAMDSAASRGIMGTVVFAVSTPYAQFVSRKFKTVRSFVGRASSLSPPSMESLCELVEGVPSLGWNRVCDPRLREKILGLILKESDGWHDVLRVVDACDRGELNISQQEHIKEFLRVR
jgi:hypothetical protein